MSDASPASGEAVSPVPASQPVTAASPTPLNQFTRRTLSPHVIEQCYNLFFRQSFINDYLTCPNMALYRWVLNLDQSAPFMSATLGSAGHAVIYKIHTSRKYDYTYMEVLTMLEEAYNEQLKKEAVYPTLPKGCDTPQEAFSLLGPEYAKLILGYQYHPRNKEFHSTFHEQSFVLEIGGLPDSNDPTGTRLGSRYLFTGQIDQGGYYDDGQLVVRDTKFRDNNFRPSRTELDLNVQATIYCAAVRFGTPACPACRPKNIRDDIDNTITLQYDGPCESCAAKIGTPAWPRKYPNKFELVWMNDFDVHQKDQHEKEVIDNTKPKIPNPKGKGPPVYPRTFNPKWAEGYKKGEYKGVGFMPTSRPPSSLNVMMSDVLRICDQIRAGVFYRNPNDACNFFCKHRDSCVKGMELEVKETALDQISAVGTEDPW